MMWLVYALLGAGRRVYAHLGFIKKCLCNHVINSCISNHQYICFGRAEGFFILFHIRGVRISGDKSSDRFTRRAI